MNNYRELIIASLRYMTDILNEESSLFANYSAQFIKEIALELEDTEVLGLATLLEKKSKDLFDAEYEHHNQMISKHQKESDIKEYIRQLCIKIFYKNNEFSVDMHKYQKIVEDNKEILEQYDIYKSLLRYVSEKTVIDKIYNKIKNNLQDRVVNNENPEMPSADLIRSLFPIELQEIYRLADQYVEPKIEALKELNQHNS